MKSIQSHLTIGLAFVMMLMCFSSGAGLLLWLRHSILDEFDRGLIANARTLQSLIARHKTGQLDVDVNLRALGDFTGRSATDYFVFEDTAGEAIIASDPGRIARPKVPTDEPWNTALPNGRSARAIAMEFVPAITDEPDEEWDDKFNTSLTHRQMSLTDRLRIVVARDRRSLDRLLLRLSLAIGTGTILLSTAAVIAAVLLVRRGLFSLRTLAGEVSEINVAAANERLPGHDRPLELVPIVSRLNELLSRVAQTISRERQFTSAVSHELRTPIAELRTINDVALREPENTALARRAVRQSQEIAIQMHTMVATLMSIATVEQAIERTPLEPIGLRAVIDASLGRRSVQLVARGLKPVNHVADDVLVSANTALLAAVLENVFGNASQYARADSELSIDAARDERHVVLTVRNEQDHLSNADLSHLFEPFWRKDAARSDAQHVGLGLTLIRTYCDAMRATVAVELDSAGRFAMRMRLLAAQGG